MSQQPRLMPRFKRRIRVAYSRAGEDRNHVAYTGDVGPGGVHVVTGRAEDVGERVVLEMDLDGEAIVLEGRITWSKVVPPQLRSIEPSGFGVQLETAPERWFSLMTELAA